MPPQRSRQGYDDSWEEVAVLERDDMSADRSGSFGPGVPGVSHMSKLYQYGLEAWDNSLSS